MTEHGSMLKTLFSHTLQDTQPRSNINIHCTKCS